MKLQVKDIGVIKALLKVKVHPDADAYDDGCTSLLNATRHGHVDCVKVLLKAGADVEMACWDNETALEVAVEGGHTEIVRLLLEAGAADYHEELNVTALQLAREKGHKACVKLLMGAGITDK